MSEIRTILADDAVGARATMAQILALEPDIEVVGEYADGPTALAAVHELRPDVAVLAHDLPGMDGVAFAESIAGSGTRALVLASMTSAPRWPAALRAGVRGWVARTAPCARLLAAVRAVAAGERYVDNDIVDDDRSSGTPLTDRERRVLTAASVCRSTREICDSAGLSAGAVGMVMSSLLAKTGGQDRLDAVRIAAARGWL